ncbi:hypothetical protein GGI25_006472 [Coemansia spiralis]|uniref:Large ribosomal subunit protein bL21m n=2 Tax=Coemansia TaxID=4863 RepID=A0A9W8KUS2_9FUNG|nr:ribosomal protein L21-like protein [Coemansia spiralis]KAJ1987425.1 hypothetical protein EDC05_005833 [Coemansia umbellata]KAJ2619327.1 hypothetical protein GGI26_005935 [Coemansia sp. RSA 1358]KAJ2668221.1 hypothetical protein GGI25_006472 [Coemansia spiralis]
MSLAAISRSLFRFSRTNALSGAACGRFPLPQQFSYSTQQTAAENAQAPIKWSSKTAELISRLRDQQKYYATVVIKGRPFTVTQNDIVVMDRIKELELGDSLALTQVTELGSRDYTIKGQPFVDPSLYSIKATVIEHPDGKLFTVTKKRRRTAHQKTTYHRNHYTMLRISLVDINKI